jgi:hypothetical protein
MESFTSTLTPSDVLSFWSGRETILPRSEFSWAVDGSAASAQLQVDMPTIALAAKARNHRGEADKVLFMLKNGL